MGRVYKPISFHYDDHTTFCDGAGNFLVVNGETGQPANTTNVIWGQTVQGEWMVR